MEPAIETRQIIKDYDRIYSTTGLKANTAYYKWIIRLIRLKPGSRLLDVSCGEGRLLGQVQKLNKRIVTCGLDISINALRITRANARESKIVQADGQKIPFQEKFFDYITCLGSLEHYQDPESGIRELARVAKKDALFCIALPNSLAADCAGKFQIIERTATKGEWIALLDKNGLKVEKTYASNLWPELFQEGTFKIKSIPKYLKRLLIRHFSPLNLAREFIFICSGKGKTEILRSA